MSARIVRSLPEPLVAGGNAVFDLSCAPFSVQDGAGPAEVAAQIVASYEVARTLSDKLTRALDAVVCVLGLPQDAPLARAARALANDVDAGAGDGRANPYHNSQHYCEVMLAACYLAQRASLNTSERAQLLVAALAHDIHHDGRSAIGRRFRLESLAVQATLPYLNEAGIPRDEQSRIMSLMLATEVTTGVAYARQCYAHFFAGAPLPPVPEAAAGLAAGSVSLQADALDFFGDAVSTPHMVKRLLRVVEDVENISHF